MERTNRIQVLSSAVVNKIAAGEVIERPASVIKELLENSLDALCTRIDVEIELGGTELIRIVDDGEGMLPEDLPLAVTSHATSKLKQADDLFCVKTMGFRGEALASIAEVSKFCIRSRAAENEIGAELAVDCGTRSEITPVGCPQGTQIEIRHLFCNTPVRRKFLKKPGTEFGYISDQFTRVALACPRLQMSLTHNGKSVYRLPATHDLLERLRLFFGSKTVDQLIPVEAEHSGIRLWGYVGHPAMNKSTRKSQYLFLNGRYIQDRSLLHALKEAYRGLLMVGRHPVAFLFLEMPSDQVDVNVHPTKSEVRFRDSQLLFRLLLSTLRTKFLQSDLHSELSINQPTRGFERKTETKQAKVEQDLVSWAKVQLEKQVAQPPAAPQQLQSPGQLSSGLGESSTDSFASAVGEHRPDQTKQPMSELYGNQLNGPAGNLDVGNAPSQIPPHTPGQNVEPAAATQASHLDYTRPQIQALQIDDCYIVLKTDQGLTVIDQHALHERVLYERFRHKILDERVEVQKLLVPVTIEMDAKQCSLLLDHREMLQELGFCIEEFGRGMVAVSSHPVFLGKNVIEDVVRDFAEKFDSSANVTRRELLDETLHMMACKAAIKAGQQLTPEEIISLLAQREGIEDAHHCPHGRPTALILSREDLDRQFGRLGA